MGQNVPGPQSVHTGDEISETIAKRDNQKLIEQLKLNVNPDGLNTDGVCHLLKAWQMRQRRTFEVLLEFGADPHQVFSKDIAIKVDEHEIVLPAGSSLAFTTVHQSFFRPEFLEVVLRYLKQPDQRNPQQRTILHAYIDSHRKRWDRGAELAYNNPLNESYRELPIVLILNAGVDINAVDRDGRTALDLIIPENPPSPEYLAKFAASKSNEPLVFDITSFGFNLGRRGASLYIKSKDGLDYDEKQNRLVEKYKEYVKPKYNPLEESRKAQTLRDGIPRPTPVSKPEKIVFPIKFRAEEPDDFSSIFFLQIFRDDMTNEIGVSAQGLVRTAFELKPSGYLFLEARPFEELVRIGFEPNTVGFGGFTFLWVAMLSARNDEFNQLIKMNASPDRKLTDDLWETAIPYSHLLKIQILSGGHFWPQKGDTVLMATCLNPFRRKQFVEPALAVTAEPNQRDNLGRNLLHLLLYHPLLEGQETLVEKLIQAGVDVNARTVGGATPAHIAVQ